MRTETFTVYTVDELAPEALEKAHQNYTASGFEYAWLSEYHDSLKAFCDLFPVKLKDNSWSTWGYSYTDLEFMESDEIAELTGWRLATYIWTNYRAIWRGRWFGSFSRPAEDPPIYHRKLKRSTHSVAGRERYYEYHGLQLETQSCPFTGFCGDEDLLAPIWEFLRHPRNDVSFAQLMESCADSLTKSVTADMEAQESLEYFIDHAQANEYGFTADGARCYRI